MCRTLFVFGAVGLIALVTGCTMCAHPYDYCGPTFMGQCGESCAPDARAGSILSDTIEPIYTSEMVDAEMVDGQIVNGQIVNGQIVNGQIVNGQIVNGQIVDGQMVDGQVLPMVHGPITSAGRAPWQAVGPYPSRSASRTMRAPPQPRWR